MNKDVHLYIGYMNEEQKNKFNLKDNKYIHLLNLSNHIEGEDINDINCHYSELCVAYYVWKHQLKSDYVSIGQHRRYISQINFERLDNNEIQVFPKVSYISKFNPYQHMLKDGFDNYLIISFIKYLLKHKLANKDKIYDVIYNKKFEVSYFNVFACNWNVFNKICEFIFGFMQDIMFTGSYDSLNDMNEFNDDIRKAFDNEKFLVNEDELFSSYEYGRFYTIDRNIAAIFELLIPLYGKICYDIFLEYPSKKLILQLNEFNTETVWNDVFKWISKNTFTGTINYYIKTKSENVELLQNILNENEYGLTSGIITVIDYIDDNLKNEIVLQLNEYVDVDNPLDELDINNIKTYEL